MTTQTPTDAARADYYTQPAEAVLGDRVICHRCSATLATYADACTAALDDPCPGFLTIEDAVALATMGAPR